jgi:hypothetical protein
MMVKEVNAVVESSKLQGLVENAYKLQQPTEEVDTQIAPPSPKRLEPPLKKLPHPFNVLQSRMSIEKIHLNEKMKKSFLLTSDR